METAFYRLWLHAAGQQDRTGIGCVVIADGCVRSGGRRQTKSKLTAASVHLTERVETFEAAFDETQQRIPGFLRTVGYAGLQFG